MAYMVNSEYVFCLSRKDVGMILRIGTAKKEIRLGTILLCLIAAEASLLGSGRLLHLGPLTLKMWLFLAAQLYVVARLFARAQLKLSTLILLLSIIVLLCLGTMIGMLQHSTFELIGIDVSPLLYFCMLLFFDMTLNTQKQIRWIIQIIESAAIIMAGGYIILILLLLFGVINFLTLYRFLSSFEREFLFRGTDGFLFYKGALYIAIGMIFFAFEKSRWAKLALAVSAIGLITTGTRGFFVALAGVVLVHVCTSRLSVRRKLIYVALACACSALLLSVLAQQFHGEKKSDAVRVETVQQVEDRITPWSLLLGNGLGVGVPVRPFHMEIAYLEIFHKQGLLGVLWWSSIFALLVVRYSKARKVNYLYAQPLFLAAIYVAFESISNEYIGNPIGIFVWIFALVGLDVISNDSARKKSIDADVGSNIPLITKSLEF